MQIQAGDGSRFMIFWRHAVIDKPGEDIANAGLARFIPVQARDDAAINDAAHAIHFFQFCAGHHMTG